MKKNLYLAALCLTSSLTPAAIIKLPFFQRPESIFNQKEPELQAIYNPSDKQYQDENEAISEYLKIMPQLDALIITEDNIYQAAREWEYLIYKAEPLCKSIFLSVELQELLEKKLDEKFEELRKIQ